VFVRVVPKRSAVRWWRRRISQLIKKGAIVKKKEGETQKRGEKGGSGDTNENRRTKVQKGPPFVKRRQSGKRGGREKE